MSRQEAIEFFKSKNEDYKVELIEDGERTRAVYVED